MTTPVILGVAGALIFSGMAIYCYPSVKHFFRRRTRRSRGDGQY